MRGRESGSAGPAERARRYDGGPRSVRHAGGWGCRRRAPVARHETRARPARQCRCRKPRGPGHPPPPRRAAAGPATDGP
ncbi:hypothetical protein KCH_61610 [Kitasatospora cheerisanensis KCTC 2395]|uniref:Uncharacterized protein n=1 Tax=Kitasatospora cheerisanensis KCTC 2395 TaxID=1348663 RepID=A0A066YLG1_9ACTN|nr:hypothetical protein KCH_61610 [Kitasatospora cheerisanensis KCTC 2395]